MIHLLACNLADSSMIVIASLSCADSLEASQVHGDTDTTKSQLGQQVEQG